jgi:hypothetical protein
MKRDIASLFFGDPYGTRTHVTAVKGRCLNHLTNGPRRKRVENAPNALHQIGALRSGSDLKRKKEFTEWSLRRKPKAKRREFLLTW